MNYIEVADLFLNLDHVTFIRREEHAQFGTVLAIHFNTRSDSPLFIGEQHYDELRPQLTGANGQTRPAPPTPSS
jgi:hypothetical protein